MIDPGDASQQLSETGKIETTVRRFDADGRVISEITTVEIRRAPEPDDLPIGMYL